MCKLSLDSDSFANVDLQFSIDVYLKWGAWRGGMVVQS